MSDKPLIICRKASLVAVFLLYVQILSAQSHFASFNSAVETNKKKLGTSFSLVVATADSILYQKHIGDVQPKTPFPIGASSQWLTTALVMQLADQGKLSLDDKVGKYLPVFYSYGKSYLTIRHCLSHQTGIGTEGFKLAALFEKNKYASLEAAMPAIAKKEIHANAGEQFRFGNYGITIAARIVEIVSRKRFDQLIRTMLFVPMGMRNTSFVTDDGSAPNPGSGARSTATDYTKFLQMLLHNGTYNGKKILSEAAVAEMRKIQVRKEQISLLPKSTEGFSFSLGAWAVDGNAAPGTAANVLALPNFEGSWPAVDFSGRFVFVVMAKDFSGEPSAQTYTELKALASQLISNH